MFVGETMRIKLTAVICFTAVLLLTASASLTAADKPMQIRIFPDSKPQWIELGKMYLDEIWKTGEYVEIVVSPDQYRNLLDLDYKIEIIHENLPAFYQSRMPDKAMGAYKTLDEINAKIDSIIAASPNIVSQKISIGQSHEGRDIWAFKISDNPEIDEDEPEIMFSATIHAREVITPEVLFYFIDHLTLNYQFDPRIQGYIDNLEIWFVPMINPDGYYHNQVIEPNGGGMWRKNRRMIDANTWGVDLNRNFGYEWGYDNDGSSPTPSSETYRGPSAFSEPETQTLRDWAISHEFVITVTYHSYSNLVLWPWGYDQLYSPDEEIFAAMGDSMVAFNGYDPGPAWGLYVANGVTDDWYYGEQTLKNKSFAFTFEVGGYSDGFWPEEYRISELVMENLEPNLFLLRVADNVYKLAAPTAPELTVADTVPASAYDISWIHVDSLNPAVEFELLELADYQAGTDPASDFDAWFTAGFATSVLRKVSLPTSFYSGSGDNLISRMVTQQPYTVQPGDTLTCQVYYEIETNWDYAYVEVSSDGTNFLTLPGTITTDYNPNGNNRGNGITGFSVGGWIEAGFDLSAFAGQSIYIRFSYETDSYVTEEGIFFDDISPIGTYGTEVSYNGLTSSPYTVTDQPSGQYFYKIRAKDAEDQWSTYSNLAETFVSTGFFCGDANADSDINVADVIFLINYVFKSGPAPDPAAAGDATGDGDINLADCIHLINFIFKSGPAPLCE